MMIPLSLATALVWQEAASSQDSDLLLTISDPQIVVVGPRGQGQGSQLLRDWLTHTELSLTTLRAFANTDEVILVQHGVWHVPTTGEWQGERNLASLFHVRNRRVVYFARYDTLEEALSHSHIDMADEIREVNAH